jgi:hypothetical protein
MPMSSMVQSAMSVTSTNNSFDARRQKSFDYYLEAAKQLITLATAVIAFTVTFAKDFVGGTSPFGKWVAAFAWGFYLCSIVCGLFAVYTLTGQLDPGSDEVGAADPSAEKSALPPPSIWAGNVQRTVKSQQTMFALGLAFSILFGIASLFFPPKPAGAPASRVTLSAESDKPIPVRLVPTTTASNASTGPPKGSAESPPSKPGTKTPSVKEPGAASHSGFKKRSVPTPGAPP